MMMAMMQVGLNDIVVLIIFMIMQYMTMMRRMMNLMMKMILKRGPRKQVNATLVIILTVIVMAMIPLKERSVKAHHIIPVDIAVHQEDLTSKILVENLSPSRAPILGSAGPLGASGALTGASGALDLSSSSFTANIATVKREVSGAEDKKFGQVLKTQKGDVSLINHIVPSGDLCVKALHPFGSQGSYEPSASSQDNCGQPGT